MGMPRSWRGRTEGFQACLEANTPVSNADSPACANDGAGSPMESPRRCSFTVDDRRSVRPTSFVIVGLFCEPFAILTPPARPRSQRPVRPNRLVANWTLV
jgi:hypothetical protein